MRMMLQARIEATRDSLVSTAEVPMLPLKKHRHLLSLSSRLTVEKSFPSRQEPIGVSEWIHVPGRGARGWNYNFCKIRSVWYG